MVDEQGIHVGVDVGGTKILALAVTYTGEVVARFKQPTSQTDIPLAEQVTGAVEGVLTEAGLSEGDMRGIGIAVPAVVDRQQGLIVHAPNLHVDDPHLLAAMQSRYCLPMVIGNDANLGTLAEVWLGAGRGADTVVGIFVGTGIGGGVVVDGRLRSGPEDMAGELGHLVLAVDGPECGCGNPGCFEALASRTALERELRVQLARGRQSMLSTAADEGRITSGMLASALEAGDELVTEVMSRQAHYLAQGALTVRHLLDPDMIIFGGGVIEACSGFLMPLIEAEVRADKLRSSRDVMRLAISELGDDAVALGAVSLLRADVDDLSTGGLVQISKAPSSGEPPLPEYPHLERVDFGMVVVEGREISSDIYIRADGKLRKRKKKRARKRYGTSHVVGREELETVCKIMPESLIIAQGFAGMMRLSDDALEYLAESGVQWQMLPTVEAVEAYNCAGGRRALLMHVTC